MTTKPMKTESFPSTSLHSTLNRSLRTVRRMMNTNSLNPVATRLTALLLLFALSLGFVGTASITSAQSKRGAKRGDSSRSDRTDKISSDLRERISSAASGEERVRVVLQLDAAESGPLNALLNRNGVHLKSRLRNIGASAVELPANVVEELASHSEVSYVSMDRPIFAHATGHVETTTGAAAQRTQTTTTTTTGVSLLGLVSTTTTTTTTTTFDGKGINIAVLDSGLDLTHREFSGGSRIVLSKDFTGEGRTDDPYGHGTHVASAAIGTTDPYAGIAPGSKVVNLRVLNSKGTGTISGLLSALDWVMANKGTYSIRVVNMSLGAPAIDSYKNDPICRAVRRLVDAGVVVVAAAGNNGRNSDGQKVYGQIHSPGNEPSAITVGASNTFGTDARNDDVVTSFSSRGPTRSHWTDESGVTHYDNLIKPDLVAPGNKLIYGESDRNLLVTQNPSLDAGVSDRDDRRMMYMSGTSMSSPIVAGAAAMLLQVNPNLTPNMVKCILMYTAQQLSGFNMFEQGAGQLNIEGAMRLAKVIRTDLSNNTPVGDPLLKSDATAPVPQTTIAGYTFPWGQGLMTNYTYVTGSNLMTKYQKIYGTGILVGDAILVADGILVADRTMMSDGILVGDQVMTSNGMLVGEGSPFMSCAILVGDGILVGDAILVGDGILVGDAILVGDGILVGDAFVQAQSAMLNGDATSCMMPLGK